ncbi:MAG: hypothetical protein ACUVQ1_04300 [Candidatus Kapaibacteriales bacterium]
MRKIHFVIFSFALKFLFGCINPFSPKLIEIDNSAPILSDQSTIEGVFQNFRYAYVFEDTLVYSRLLDDNFSFVYRNYDLGVDVSWGKEQDLKATYGLFQSASNIELIWSESYLMIGDTNETNIQRGFSLTIVFSPNDIVRLQGKANFKLLYDKNKSIWRIVYWRDETYF